MAELTGTIIGKYRLERLIGEGGMGVVYEARHTLVGKRCALKLLHADLAEDEQVVQRMLREAQAAAAIGHPNIVVTHDFGTAEVGGYYLVMDLLEGQTLEERMEQQGPMEVEPLVVIVLQVLSALEAAHRTGIVHRDIKPDNVYIARMRRGGEEVKLLDFGVSKFAPWGSDDLRLTRTGAVMGTPYYMSPEQASGDKNLDGRSDLWAVGVILYQGLTGRMPFSGDNYNRLMYNIQTQEPTPVRAGRPDVPAALEAVIARALGKEPDRRFGDAAQMSVALEPFGAQTAASGDLFSPKPVPEPALAVAQSEPPGERLSGNLVTMSPAQVLGSKAVVLGERRRRRLVAVGGIIGVAVVLLVVLLGVLLLGDGLEPKGGVEGQRSGEASDTQMAGLMQGSAVRVQPLPMRIAAAAKLLLISIRGLPRGAMLRLDGLPQAGPPLRLRADGKRHRLEIVAPGYQPERIRFRARAGLESLTVRMKRPPGRTVSRPMRRHIPGPMRTRPRTTSGDVYGDPYGSSNR